MATANDSTPARGGQFALTVADLNTAVNHEPCVSYRRLARALGYVDERKLLRLAERHREALERFGEVSATVAETSKKGGRPGKVEWYNKRQVLYLCAKSEMEGATEVTIQMVEIVDAHLAGSFAAAPQPLPEPSGTVTVPADILLRIAGALDRLASVSALSGPLPPAVREVDGDHLDAFLAARVRAAPGGRIQSTELYNAYAAWCCAVGRIALTHTMFGRLLAGRLDRLDGASRRFYSDVALAQSGIPAPVPGGELPSGDVALMRVGRRTVMIHTRRYRPGPKDVAVLLHPDGRIAIGTVQQCGADPRQPRSALEVPRRPRKGDPKAWRIADVVQVLGTVIKPRLSAESGKRTAAKLQPRPSVVRLSSPRNRAITGLATVRLPAASSKVPSRSSLH